MKAKVFVLILAGVITLSACTNQEVSSAPMQSSSTISSVSSNGAENLSTTAMEQNLLLEDYDTFWALVEDNFPFYHTAERITGNDFVAIKEQYRKKAAEAKTPEELHKVIKACVETFEGVGHFRTLENAPEYSYMVQLYGKDVDKFPKHAYQYKRISTLEASKYYQVDPEKKVEDFKERIATVPKDSNNIVFQDFPEDKTAYVSIAQMTASYENNDGEVLENWFADLQEKGYENCIIDIRGNGGGDSRYWRNYIVEPNAQKYLLSTNYILLKGEESLEYWRVIGANLRPIADLPIENLTALEKDDKEDATHFYTFNLSLPHTTHPKFSGKFWLLVDEGVYSSSESFAVLCKNSGFATIVGTPTGGDGIGTDPLLFSLPNSGICFRFSTAEGLNQDGSCNEEVGTSPDILIQNGEDALEVCLATIRKEK